MSFSPVTTVGLVSREIHTGSRDGTPTKIAVARRLYATDQADLWDAITNAERLPRWFLPISGDLKVGGHYQLEGNAGGVVERCQKPDSFAVTWEFGGMGSWLDIHLTPDSAGTVLELRHESHVDPEMWEQFGPGAVGVGWDLAFLGLAEYIDTKQPVDPEEGAAFGTTAVGKEFVGQVASSWADAAVRDGDEPDAAHGAAGRAAAFFTIPPEDVPEGASDGTPSS